MVDFVLHRPRFEAGDLSPIRTALNVKRLDSYGEWAFDIGVDVRNREAAFFGGLDDVAYLNDAWVDQDQRRWVVLAYVDDRHASRVADLVRREAHASERSHGLE